MVLKDAANSDILIKLYRIYDSHRDAILWFLEELDVDSYEEYIQKYGGFQSKDLILLLFVDFLSYQVLL